jgi:hypothetical protein
MIGKPLRMKTKKMSRMLGMQIRRRSERKLRSGRR